MNLVLHDFSCLKFEFFLWFAVFGFQIYVCWSKEMGRGGDKRFSSSVSLWTHSCCVSSRFISMGDAFLYTSVRIAALGCFLFQGHNVTLLYSITLTYEQLQLITAAFWLCSVTVVLCFVNVREQPVFEFFTGHKRMVFAVENWFAVSSFCSFLHLYAAN